MNKAKLIVFEGISGTGKETQAVLLKEYLAKKKITANIVYHPTPEVKLLLSQWRKERNIDHITEVYLFLADRYDRVRQTIKPALARGEWVISLRSWVSALVYQGKTKEERTWITDEFSRFELTPDAFLYFDLTPEIAFARIRKRYETTGEAMGKFESLDVLHAKYKIYRDVLTAIPHAMIAADQSIEDVHTQITQCLP